MKLTKLEELRKAKGYSRSTLADISGVSVRSIEAYEQGLRDLTKARLPTLKKLAKALKVDISDLVLDDENYYTNL